MTSGRQVSPVAAWARVNDVLGELERNREKVWGASVEGRPIAGISFGQGPTTLVLGGIHGDEPAGFLAAFRFAWEAPSDCGHVVVLPAVNPDGLLAHRKDNARGVDLNRNYPTRDFGNSLPAGYHPGERGASEPETRAVLASLAAVSPARVLSLHQPFACVNFDGPAEDWAKAVSRASGLPVRADLGYPTPGSLGTYLGLERRVPVITLELGRGDPESEWVTARRALLAALRFDARS